MCFDTLLLAGESQMLEFKASFDRAIVDSPVALTNAQDGTSTKWQNFLWSSPPLSHPTGALF